MNAGPGFAYSRGALSAAQSASVSVGSQVAQTPARLSGATPQAVSAHPGWESSAALQGCLTAWEQRLRQLAAQVQQISKGLATTIDGYDTAEAQVISEIRRAAAGLEAGRAKAVPSAQVPAAPETSGPGR